ncbi:hypothetical protein PoB_000772600 [Plakobranchus ocellatus]|uniref:C2H2-type domain-containing protein n=1 Tax=Plakobranchus ocellatus TaxID=259542 RepID=A0AAV3YFR2_9GAST|nr:hypothetical protein PoB_000772600 [Plakobranchus ocellatus]
MNRTVDNSTIVEHLVKHVSGVTPMLGNVADQAIVSSTEERNVDKNLETETNSLSFSEEVHSKPCLVEHNVDESDSRGAEGWPTVGGCTGSCKNGITTDGDHTVRDECKQSDEEGCKTSMLSAVIEGSANQEQAENCRMGLNMQVKNSNGTFVDDSLLVTCSGTNAAAVTKIKSDEQCAAAGQVSNSKEPSDDLETDRVNYESHLAPHADAATNPDQRLHIKDVVENGNNFTEEDPVPQLEKQQEIVKLTSVQPAEGHMENEQSSTQDGSREVGQNVEMLHESDLVDDDRSPMESVFKDTEKETETMHASTTGISDQSLTDGICSKIKETELKHVSAVVESDSQSASKDINEEVADSQHVILEDESDQSASKDIGEEVEKKSDSQSVTEEDESDQSASKDIGEEMEEKSDSQSVTVEDESDQAASKDIGEEEEKKSDSQSVTVEDESDQAASKDIGEEEEKKSDSQRVTLLDESDQSASRGICKEVEKKTESKAVSVLNMFEQSLSKTETITRGDNEVSIVHVVSDEEEEDTAPTSEEDIDVCTVSFPDAQSDQENHTKGADTTNPSTTSRAQQNPQICMGNGVLCVECNETFTDQMHFSEHIICHLWGVPRAVGQCALCGLVFSSGWTMASHLASANNRLIAAVNLSEKIRGSATMGTTKYSKGDQAENQIEGPGSKDQDAEVASGITEAVEAKPLSLPLTVKEHEEFLKEDIECSKTPRKATVKFETESSPSFHRQKRKGDQLSCKDGRRQGVDPEVEGYLLSLVEQGLSVDPGAFGMQLCSPPHSPPKIQKTSGAKHPVAKNNHNASSLVPSNNNIGNSSNDFKSRANNLTPWAGQRGRGTNPCNAIHNLGNKDPRFNIKRPGSHNPNQTSYGGKSVSPSFAPTQEQLNTNSLVSIKKEKKDKVPPLLSGNHHIYGAFPKQTSPSALNDRLSLSPTHKSPSHSNLRKSPPSNNASSVLILKTASAASPSIRDHRIEALRKLRQSRREKQGCKRVRNVRVKMRRLVLPPHSQGQWPVWKLNFHTPNSHLSSPSQVLLRQDKIFNGQFKNNLTLPLKSVQLAGVKAPNVDLRSLKIPVVRLKKLPVLSSLTGSVKVHPKFGCPKTVPVPVQRQTVPLILPVPSNSPSKEKSRSIFKVEYRSFLELESCSTPKIESHIIPKAVSCSTPKAGSHRITEAETYNITKVESCSITKVESRNMIEMMLQSVSNPKCHFESFANGISGANFSNTPSPNIAPQSVNKKQSCSVPDSQDCTKKGTSVLSLTGKKIQTQDSPLKVDSKTAVSRGSRGQLRSLKFPDKKCVLAPSTTADAKQKPAVQIPKVSLNEVIIIDDDDDGGDKNTQRLKSALTSDQQTSPPQLAAMLNKADISPECSDKSGVIVREVCTVEPSMVVDVTCDLEKEFVEKEQVNSPGSQGLRDAPSSSTNAEEGRKEVSEEDRNILGWKVSVAESSDESDKETCENAILKSAMLNCSNSVSSDSHEEKTDRQTVHFDPESPQGKNNVRAGEGACLHKEISNNKDKTPYPDAVSDRANNFQDLSESSSKTFENASEMAPCPNKSPATPLDDSSNIVDIFEEIEKTCREIQANSDSGQQKEEDFPMEN